jgi:hypothetical protein
MHGVSMCMHGVYERLYVCMVASVALASLLILLILFFLTHSLKNTHPQLQPLTHLQPLSISSHALQEHLSSGAVSAEEADAIWRHHLLELISEDTHEKLIGM